MKQICHRWEKWEDYRDGMYAQSHPDPEGTILESLELLSDHELLYYSMKHVCKEWPYATEHNLTDTSRNRRAWLGQAACCHHHGATEMYTRMAWGSLNEDQQRLANESADRTIDEWESEYTSACQNQLNLFKAA